MAEVAVTTRFLEMRDAGEVVGVPEPEGWGRLLRVTACPASFYRCMYREVGRDYNWHSRHDWGDREIEANLARRGVALFVLYDAEGVAGFFELRRDGAEVEVVYLGLVPSRCGRGLGRYLVTCALREAWGMGAGRVWLHTCTLDHPAAMRVYLAAGLRVYKEEQGVELLLEVG